MRYIAHDYQKYATQFILDHPIAAVFLEMGLGKSVITLTALFDLCLDQFLIRKVLVIAPLRVARDTWAFGNKEVGSLAGAYLFGGGWYRSRTEGSAYAGGGCLYHKQRKCRLADYQK